MRWKRTACEAKPRRELREAPCTHVELVDCQNYARRSDQEALKGRLLSAFYGRRISLFCIKSHPNGAGAPIEAKSLANLGVVQPGKSSPQLATSLHFGRRTRR